MKGKVLALFTLGPLCLALVSKASGQVGFARTDYPAGAQPAALVIADFNADGKADLAVANFGSNNVSILLGNGNGTFSPQTFFNAGMGPVSVATGDFNGDNKLDLVAANVNSNTVSVLLGNGSGTFGAASGFATGNNPVYVAVGDFNADNKLDLAVANQNSDSISVLLGNGDGTFGTKTDFITGAQPFWLIVADFNGDSKLDLASANPASNTVSVLLGNGNGTFGAKTDFATGTFPRAVVAADFRKLLRLDLATANENGSSVSVLLGRGNGTFDPRTDLGTDTEPLAITAADFDNDGKPDLLTSNVGYVFAYCSYYYGCLRTAFPTVSLLRGNGDGTFSPRTDFSIGFDQSPVSVATADFNGDGRVDAVTANQQSNSVSVLLQSPTVTLSPVALDFGNQNVGTTSSSHSAAVTSTGSFPVTIGSVSLGGTAPGDFSKAADTCSGASVAPGNSCNISVTFTPTALGSRSAFLNIPDNAPGSPHRVDLTGAGVPIDSEPPDTSISSAVDGNGAPVASGKASLSNTITFTFIGTDNVAVAGFECHLEGPGFSPCTSPLTYNSLAVGRHDFGVRAVDTSNNRDNTPALFTWTVDTPPETTITSAIDRQGRQIPNGGSTSSNVMTLSFTGTDNVSVAGFECSLDGTAFAPCTSPITSVRVNPGTHTFRVRAADNNGFRDPTPAGFTWTRP